MSCKTNQKPSNLLKVLHLYMIAIPTCLLNKNEQTQSGSYKSIFEKILFGLHEGRLIPLPPIHTSLIELLMMLLHLQQDILNSLHIQLLLLSLTVLE